MLQRFRGVIDRTIAEEQARQKTDTTPPSRSASTSSRKGEAPPGKRSRSKKQPSDTSDAAPNPDPAVFEAAFVIDDSDEPSRSGTPKPPIDNDATDEKTTLGPNGSDGKSSESSDKDGTSNGKTQETPGDDSGAASKKPDAAAAAPATGLTPEIKQRLRKLEKLEATYPELLRSYRVAHRRATAIEPFEKALRENTPLTSIADPDSLIEYLNQLNQRGDMVMQELKRVTTEKDELQKKHDKAEEKAKKLEEELEVAKAGKADDAEKPKDSQDDKTEDVTGRVRSPVASVIGMFSPKHRAQKSVPETIIDKEDSGDLFSYEDEVPQLQAEVFSKSEEIDKLKNDVETLRNELSTTKESSAGLVENLEKATRELSESRDFAATQQSLQTQLDARNTEIATLNKRLTETRAQLKQLEDDNGAQESKIQVVEASLATSDKRTSELNAELAKASSAKAISKKLIDDLNAQIEVLKKDKTESQTKLDELSKKLETRTAPAAASTPIIPASQPAPAPAAATPASAGSKKKNKKKKGKGGGGGGAASAPAPEEPVVQTPEPEAPIETPGTAELEAEIAQLKEEVAEKDGQIERLAKKRKTEEDLREEIESLEENLIAVGQDHVEAKEKIKALEAEKVDLKSQIADLEEKMTSSASDAKASSKLQSEMSAVQREFEDLKDKTATLQADLGAAQLLAQNRYKDLTDLREVLQKAQPELRSLRQESATLKTTKEELAAKAKELKDMEKREKDLKRDLSRAQQISSDRDTEIKGLQERLTTETNTKVRLEDAQRVSGRDLRRAEAEKVELSAKAEKAERELQVVQEELSKLRPRVKDLEEQLYKLKREKTAMQEEVEFKGQQYTNAQGLLSSMRDQTAEMTVQLKESKSQAESLEEELAEVQRLLQERTREGETMRRLLADVDERADNKVRDMRARMEAAVEERDRIEDESSTLARRKARETEDLKQKLRDLEREVKTLGNERDELEQREKEWRRRREELESVEEKAEAETAEMRTTVSQLRTALDASENQVRDVEKQRVELRRMLEEARVRYEKLSKDLKTTQSKLVAGSSRSSFDSQRSGNNGAQPGGAPETAYIKTILLQFLEQKDSKLRAQLVPVLGKLLRFDKTDEQKWMKAVQHIDVR
ncbi:hypothetical protein B0J13DRAFT_506237 [Dactylonectria estremocensis]|uniref:GRIP domain-containing protein n=1 Tax=Dactylonectria estremocensis TaxID=1079267 RepID=A0A9P9EHG3_9HYPO|nr:hypothetical protein B0J13DRAFT_506237 [Dactylonectria estremocensis]